MSDTVAREWGQPGFTDFSIFLLLGRLMTPMEMAVDGGEEGKERRTAGSRKEGTEW